ncbi:hypothetical protein DL96DRAFT_208420 [Flagelloscypha sp. PMI_526]|nr:hypothetical protein DL96DRAFT_208420 [Flagelloscypha sp. PMI_526]
MDVDTTESNNSPSPLKIKALSPVQQRRLTDYLDEQFIELMRQFKKRSEPNARFASLESYVAEIQRLLALILRIPPIDPSTYLRTTYLLRLCNECLNSVLHYQPPSPSDSDALGCLLDVLDDLDQAWIVVLHSQIWDPEEGGTDLILSVEAVNHGKKSTPPSITEQARIRSFALGSLANLQEWVSQRHNTMSEKKEDPQVQEVGDLLARMGLGQRFDKIFERTIEELGGLYGGETEDIDAEICDPGLPTCSVDNAFSEDEMDI